MLSSRSQLLEEDGALGLFGSPRRFNVAVTRGQAFTCVVGNPFLLHQDPNWRKYIEYCTDHGAYLGVPCALLNTREEEEADADEMLNAVAHLTCLGAAADNVQYPTDIGSV